MKNRVELNKEVIRDKILACWTGKNIGGTMGAPYEGNRDILDVKGFATEKGIALPNDDLDLQLVWLGAIEEYGPYNITPSVLSEYWIRCIPPFWNEYGTGKANIKSGILPLPVKQLPKNRFDIPYISDLWVFPYKLNGTKTLLRRLMQYTKVSEPEKS